MKKLLLLLTMCTMVLQSKAVLKTETFSGQQIIDFWECSGLDETEPAKWNGLNTSGGVTISGGYSAVITSKKTYTNVSKLELEIEKDRGYPYVEAFVGDTCMTQMGSEGETPYWTAVCPNVGEISINIVLEKLFKSLKSIKVSYDDAAVPRNLSFNVNRLEVTLGASFQNPVLSGYADGVVYSSSNTDVADITDRGTLYIKKAGEAVITASCGKTDLFESQSAEFKVVVSPMFAESEVIKVVTSKGGEVEEKIKQSGVLRPDAIKVIGPIDGGDILFMKSAQGLATNLVYIDLSDATLEASSDVVYAVREVHDGIGNGGDNYNYILSDRNETVFMESQSTGLGGSIRKYTVYTNAFDMAFAYSKIKYLALPSTLDRVGGWICVDAQYLEAVSFPANIDSIGTSAFALCRSLSAVAGLTDNIRYIGASAFSECQKFMDVSWLGNAEEIGNSAFKSICISQNMLALPKAKIIGDEAFYHNEIYQSTSSENDFKGLYGVVIGDDIVEIGENAFAECALTSAVIGSGLQKIGTCAFAKNEALSNVEMRGWPKYVGRDVFYRTPWYASLPSEGGLIYLGNILWGYADNGQSLPTTLSVKEGTVTIAVGMYNNKLTDFSLPESVKVLGGWFWNNENLRKRISLPSKVEYIGDYAFYDAKRLSFDRLPESVRYIGQNAFQGCEMAEVYIGKNVEFIGYEAFRDVAMTSISYYAPNVESTYGTLSSCFNLADVEIIEFGKNVNYIPGSAFSNAKKAYIVFPDAMDSDLTIGDYAFAGTTMKTITLPKGTEKINEYAFGDCENLTELLMPEGLKEIGDRALYSCPSLMKIELPSSVEILGDRALYQDEFKQGRTLIIHSAPEEIGDMSMVCRPTEVICEVAAPFDFDYKISTYGFCHTTEANRVTVKVPAESLQLYKDNSQWNCYNLVADNSGLEEIGVETAEIKSIYSLDGIFQGNDVDALNAGAYIVTTADGSIRKIIKRR